MGVSPRPRCQDNRLFRGNPIRDGRSSGPGAPANRTRRLPSDQKKKRYQSHVVERSARPQAAHFRLSALVSWVWEYSASRNISPPRERERVMFKKSKSKVLVDEASEEDDVSWQQEHARKDKDLEGTQEVLSPSTKDSKLKKVKSKREKGDKKLFPSQDDEHILLTGVTLSHRRGITMTMKQITPITRKVDRMEGWAPPQLTDDKSEEEEEEKKRKSEPSPLSTPLSLSLPSWVGLGSEEDSSRYSSLTDSQTGRPAQWAARARDKLASVRRRSPANLSESSWEGLK
ncbi:hypothetical protein DNTS_014088 [Danionella cerebrum]|uniref:Uncharacterized protein n=1 Tax=Danionella cerebrum TaxID=2873325 RepID=A0A553QF33_9TELE|nr:hypothetical protein DNTS_014088 [Danionella translucida]